MKNTGVCPKCSSTDIRVDRRRTWANMFPFGLTVFAAFYGSRFVCASCGYVEAWVESERALKSARKRLRPMRP